MDRYETTASKAETDILKMLSADGQVYRPWQLTGHDLQARTLKTTSDEVKLLLEREAYLRPGFKVENDTVYVPNLFVKLSGQEDSEYLRQDFWNDGTRGFCRFYSSIQDFANEPPFPSIEKIPEILNEKGLIDQQKLIDSGIYRYSFLRIEYQKIVINKINYIIEQRKKLFLSQVANDLNKLISALLNLDEKLLTLFNNFDFQYHLPKVIIENGDRSSFTEEKAFVLILLNLLGFDIIIHSPQSFADVENMINRELFDIFYFDNFCLQDQQSPKGNTCKRNTKSKYVILSVVLFTLVAAFIAIFVITGDFSGIYSKGSESNSSGSMGEIAEPSRPAGIVVTEPEKSEAPQIAGEGISQAVIDENPAFSGTENSGSDIVETPEAVKAQIPQNVKSETFNASDIIPFFRGTITKVYLPANNVDSTVDDVHIDWIKPAGDLSTDKETYVMIEVEYSLVSEDGANLSINYNNDENVSSYQMENSRFPVSKGTGMCIYYIPITPKSWSDGTPFQINSSLNHFEDPDPKKHNAFLAGTSLIPLEIK